MNFSNNMTKIYNIIKSKLLFLSIFILLGVGGVTLYTMFAITPIYSVSSTLILKIMNSEKNDSQVMEAINLFQRQAKTYLEIAALSPVKEATDKASGSQLMTLTIKASDRDLANQYIKQYVKQYKQFTTEKFGRDDLSIVTEAQGNSKPIYPILWKNMLIAFIAFSFIAFNIIFIRYVLSDSIDSSDELEELTGVPTLGMIPVIEKKGRR